MKFSAFHLTGLLLAASLSGTLSAEEKVATATPAPTPVSAPAAAPTAAPAVDPTMKHVTGEPFKDTILAFETVFAGGNAVFANVDNEKPDFHACGKIAESLDTLAEHIRSIHEDRLRQFGLEFHNKLDLLVLNAHRLKIASFEHSRDDIIKYWGQLTLMRNLLAQTKVWQ